MNRRKLYVDTGILVAIYYEGDKYNKNALNFFQKIMKLKNTDIVCSNFCITEFAQVCVKKDIFSESETYKISNALLTTLKIDRLYPFKMIDAKGKNVNYKFEEFFLDIQSIILETKPRPHLADVIHSVIMRNNKIKTIVTYNVNDFKGIMGIKAYTPDYTLSKFSA